MTLHEFTKDLRKKIDEFEQDWIIKDSNDHTGFPLNIKDGSYVGWLDLFDFFDGKDKELFN